MQILIYFFSGVLFALGLGLAGMTQPEIILAFLAWGEGWRADMMLVMVGAVTTYLVGYWLVRDRNVTLLGSDFHLPTRSDIDSRLVTGSALFGIGWGLSGLCPGPALVTLVSGSETIMVFLLAMAVGMYLWSMVEGRAQSPQLENQTLSTKTG